MSEEAKKKLLLMIPHALYVLTAEHNGQTVASTISWMTQTSFKPPLIVLGIKADSQTFKVVKESKVFNLNFFGEDQKSIAQKFFKHVEPVDGTLAGEAFTLSPQLNLPVFEHMAGHLECKVTDIVECGDHATVVAEVIGSALGPAKGPLKLESTGWSYGG